VAAISITIFNEWAVSCVINRCIRVLATKILGKILVASTRTLGRGEEPLLSSGWTLIGSELSSPSFNSSVRAERSFAIRYLNVEIKLLCGNLDRIVTERCFFGSRCSVTLLRNLTDFATEIHFGCKKPEYVNATIVRATHVNCGIEQYWTTSKAEFTWYEPMLTVHHQKLMVIEILRGSNHTVL